MQNKTILYLLIIITISLALSFLGSFLERNEVALTYGDREFIDVSKEDITMRAQRNYIFITETVNTDDKKINVYKIISEHSAYRPSTIEHGIVSEDTKSINQLVIAAASNELNIDDVKTMSYQDMVTLISTEKFIAGRWEKPVSDYWADKLDESELIFFVIAGLAFILLLLYEMILYLIKKVIGTSSTIVLDAIIIGAVIIFITYWNVDWYCLNKFPVFLENTLFLIPLYALIKAKKFKPSLDEKDQILFRFVVIIFGTIVLFNLGNFLGRWVDRFFFNGTELTGIYNRVKVNMMVGFAYSFAIADLFVNILKLIIKTKANQRNVEPN